MLFSENCVKMKFILNISQWFSKLFMSNSQQCVNIKEKGQTKIQSLLSSKVSHSLRETTLINKKKRILHSIKFELK